MKNTSLLVLVLALCVALAISGCGGTPPTPTKVAATTAPAAITVIVTATIPPPLPTLALATSTPIPTAAVTSTPVITTPVAPKPTGTARPAATKKPTVAPTAAPPTALPLKFAAPKPIEPIYNGNRKDERHFPGDAFDFRWTSVGDLGQDECYQVSVTLNPGQGDQFVTACNDHTPVGAQVRFVLNQPSRSSPNYSSLLPNLGQEIWVVWYITVVKNLGLKPDGVHHNTAPLSPASDKVQFLLKGS